MEWKLYECLTDEFSIVKRGEKFLISGGAAKAMDGETLLMDTKCVIKNSDPKGESYLFKYLGEHSGAPKKMEEDSKEPKPKTLNTDKQTQEKGKFFLVTGEPKFDVFDSLEAAKKGAEALDDKEVTVAEVRGTLSIEVITTWK